MSNIRTLNHDSVNPYNGTIPSNHVMVLRPNSQIDLRQELGRRLKAYYFGIPLLTFTLVFVILTIFLTGAILSIFGISQWKFTLTLQWLGLTMFQLWRLFTYAFIHFGFSHILFNTMAFLPASVDFEKSFGTAMYLITLILLFLPIPAVLTAITMSTYVLNKPGNYIGGISGLVFTLLAWDSLQQPNVVSLFGLVTIKRIYYPPLLLLLITLLVPESSFIGHLTGLLIGYMYSFGWFKFVTPSYDFLSRMEQKLMPNFVLKSPRYVCTRDCKEYQHLPFVAGGYHDTSRTQSGSGGGVQGRGSTGGRILGRGSGSSGLPKPNRGTSKLPTALQSEATKSNSTTTLVNTTPGSASRIGVKQPSAINPPTAGNSNHNANLNSSQDTPPSGIAVDGNGAVNPNSESYNSIQLFQNSTSNAPDLQSNLKLESGKKSKTLQNHKVLSIAKDSNETSAERSIPGDGNESFTSTPASRIRSDTSNNNSGYSLL